MNRRDFLGGLGATAASVGLKSGLVTGLTAILGLEDAEARTNGALQKIAKMTGDSALVLAAEFIEKGDPRSLKVASSVIYPDGYSRGFSNVISFSPHDPVNMDTTLTPQYAIILREYANKTRDHVAYDFIVDDPEIEGILPHEEGSPDQFFRDALYSRHSREKRKNLLLYALFGGITGNPRDAEPVINNDYSYVPGIAKKSESLKKAFGDTLRNDPKYADMLAHLSLLKGRYGVKNPTLTAFSIGELSRVEKGKHDFYLGILAYNMDRRNEIPKGVIASSNGRTGYVLVH